MNYKKIIKDKGIKQSWIAEKIGVNEGNLSMFLSSGSNKYLSTGKEVELIKLLKNYDD